MASQLNWDNWCTGVGKSTFIETFGKHLQILEKIVVLTIDPSSKKQRKYFR